MPTLAPTAQPGVSRFPCKKCGATLQFAPGTTSLVCPYCSCANDITLDPQHLQVRELDYQQTLADLRSKSQTFEHKVVRCDGCSAQIEAPPSQASFPCPFCGTSIVATAFVATHIKPNGILPFKMTRDQAISVFRAWLNSRWFAPNALKNEGRLDACFQGVYLPAWTYDAQTTTPYSGERGDAYYVTESYTVNGQRQTRQVRKVRWSSASGTVHVGFDDILVMASKSLPIQQLESLDPWKLEEVQPYADAFLAGFRAETYQIPLDEGFVIAQGKMEPTIDDAIRSDIGGDEQRISQKRTAYRDITFKHVLLPIWLSAYRYNNKVYRFVVNARTGEVVGERPYSAIKIALFVLMILAILGLIALGVAAAQSR